MTSELMLLNLILTHIANNASPFKTIPSYESNVTDALWDNVRLTKNAMANRQSTLTGFGAVSTLLSISSNSSSSSSESFSSSSSSESSPAKKDEKHKQLWSIQ